MFDWLFGRRIIALINARFDRLERLMADDTQTLLDKIIEEEQDADQAAATIAAEFKTLNDKIAGMGPTVNTSAVLAELDKLKTKIAGTVPADTAPNP